MITWAEFELRSFGFWQTYREDRIEKARINYRLYCLGFIASKEKPKPFKQFLQKEYGISIKSKVQEDKVLAMQEAWENYQKEING